MKNEVQPKRWGRQKGTPNRPTIQFQSKLEDLGFDPIERLIEAYQLIDSPEARANICLRMAEFIYPRRKAIEMDPEDLEKLAFLKLLDKMTPAQMDLVVKQAAEEGKDAIHVPNST